MRVDEDAIETLSPEECRRRLSEGGVACLALPEVDGAPVLRPVNFVLDDDALVVRTGEGRIFDAAQRSVPAALLLHGIDKLEHTGWSVIATGALTEREGDARHDALPLRAWAPGRKERFVALALEELSGLRILPGRGNR